MDHSPAAHVRRPRADYESHAVALDCNELGALLVTAGLGLLAPRTARTIDLAIGERTDAPVFLAPMSGGWTGTAPGGSSARSHAAPESARPSRLARRSADDDAV